MICLQTSMEPRSGTLVFSTATHTSFHTAQEDAGRDDGTGGTLSWYYYLVVMQLKPLQWTQYEYPFPPTSWTITTLVHIAPASPTDQYTFCFWRGKYIPGLPSCHAGTSLQIRIQSRVSRSFFLLPLLPVTPNAKYQFEVLPPTVSHFYRLPAKPSPVHELLDPLYEAS